MDKLWASAHQQDKPGSLDRKSDYEGVLYTKHLDVLVVKFSLQ